MVLGSIVNLFQVAIELGTLTVLSWSCTLDYGPLVWAILPFSIHLVAAISYHIEVAHTEKQVRKEIAEDRTPRSPLTRSMTFLQKRAQLSWLHKEFTICANQPKGLEALMAQKRTSRVAVLLNCIASLMAFFHLLFGTMLFSSLIFIAVWDILNSIIWRYLISTVVCRLILLIELAGLREPMEEETEKIEERYNGLRDRVNGMASRVDVLMNEREARRGDVEFREGFSSLAERMRDAAGGVEDHGGIEMKRLSFKGPRDEIHAVR